MSDMNTRRHPDPDNRDNYVEQTERNRYGVSYKVEFKDGRKPIFGEISVIEAKSHFFRFLERGSTDQLGMLGYNGIQYDFDECRGVYEEDRQSPGYYSSEDQILFWKISAGMR